MNKPFSVSLTTARVPFTSYFYGSGSHAWPYWMRDLRRFLPIMEHAFAHPRPTPPRIPFAYRTTANRFTIWGWTFSARRPAWEFTYLTHVGPNGLTVAGSGTITVATPSLYQPEHRYTITISGTQTQTVNSSTEGSLSFTIALGRGHGAKQTRFPVTHAPTGWDHASVSIDPAHD